MPAINCNVIRRTVKRTLPSHVSHLSVAWISSAGSCRSLREPAPTRLTRHRPQVRRVTHTAGNRKLEETPWMCRRTRNVSAEGPSHCSQEEEEEGEQSAHGAESPGMQCL
eukprot:5125977-Prymnesium_polylepis.1